MSELGTCHAYDEHTIYIRAKTLDEYSRLLEFFTQMGMVFVIEKHGSGPAHHSCQRGNDVFEIYPPKV